MIKRLVAHKSRNSFAFHHSYNEPDQSKPLVYNADAHAQYEFMLVLKGTVRHKINGETYLIRPGELVLVNIHELHSVEIDLSDGYERIVFLFTDKIIPKFNDMDLLKPFHTAINFGHIIPKEYVSKSKIYDLLNECSRLRIEKPTHLDAKLTCCLIQILIELLEITENMQKDNYTTKIKVVAVNKLLQDCSKYINSNLSKNFSVEEIAKHLHISHSHLYHVLKKEMGITLHAFILNQKMQRAVIYLNEGISPQEISTRLGYPYYSTFYSNFKAFFGYPPSKRKQKNNPPATL